MQDSQIQGGSPLSRFLISIGIVLINIYIFNMFSEWICMRLFHTDVGLLLSKHLYADLTDTQIHALRFSQAFTSFGGFVMSSFVIMQVFQQNPWDHMRINTFPSARFALVGVILFFSFMPLIQQILEWNQWIFKDMQGGMADMFHNMEKQNNRMYALLLKDNTGYMLWINLLVMALIPALGEEIFFRGVLFRIFENWTGRPHAAVWLTSVLFAVIHFQIFKVLPMALMAGMFGYLLYFSRSLWLGIILHFLNNALVIVAHSLQQSGYKYRWLADDYTFHWSWVLVGTIIGVGAFLYLSKHRKHG